MALCRLRRSFVFEQKPDCRVMAVLCLVDALALTVATAVLICAWVDLEQQLACVAHSRRAEGQLIVELLPVVRFLGRRAAKERSC